MAVVLNVHSRLPTSKSVKFQISIGSLQDNTDAIFSAIGKELSLTDDDFDVIHDARVLKPETKLSVYFIEEHSTVYVVRKFTKEAQSEADPGVANDPVRKNEVIMAIQSALLNQDYRSTVERVLLNGESIDNVILTTPGLDKDPAVLLMLQDPELLAILAHPNNLGSLLSHHPAFAQAAVTMATVVNEESAKIGMKADSPVSYSMDQMSDEEDIPIAQPIRSRGTSGGQNITASQLAAALQSAAGSSSQAPASAGAFPPPFQNPHVASNIGSTITSDFFQQAMAHAQSASSDAALQQLREMGITDDNVARQALAATNGDIQAAIDLIFGDGFM